MNPVGAKVHFASSNEAVATVDTTGLITALAPGEAQITVTATMEGYTSAQVTIPVAVGSPGGGGPSLSATKTVDKTTAYPGDTLTFTISYKNTGNGGATGVVITDTVDTNLENVQVQNNGTYDPAAGKITWNIDRVSAGGQGSVAFAAKIKAGTAAGTKIKDTAVIDSDQTNPVNTNTTETTVATSDGGGGGDGSSGSSGSSSSGGGAPPVEKLPEAPSLTVCLDIWYMPGRYVFAKLKVDHLITEKLTTLTPDPCILETSQFLSIQEEKG